MKHITFKGTEVNLVGSPPRVGSIAPQFTLCKTDLSPVTLKDLQGKRVVLNTFPSIDTPVCASSVRRFNIAASKLDNTVVLCISMDLPFAHARFCSAEEIEAVVPVSDFRTGNFGKEYGLRIADGLLEGLLTRSVIIINEAGKVIYSEIVPDITQEPDYDTALRELS